jgi:hypothetical protein
MEEIIPKTVEELHAETEKRHKEAGEGTPFSESEQKQRPIIRPKWILAKHGHCFNCDKNLQGHSCLWEPKSSKITCADCIEATGHEIKQGVTDMSRKMETVKAAEAFDKVVREYGNFDIKKQSK